MQNHLNLQMVLPTAKQSQTCKWCYQLHVVSAFPIVLAAQLGSSSMHPTKLEAINCYTMMNFSYTKAARHQASVAAHYGSRPDWAVLAPQSLMRPDCFRLGLISLSLPILKRYALFFSRPMPNWGLHKASAQRKHNAWNWCSQTITHTHARKHELCVRPACPNLSGADFLRKY